MERVCSVTVSDQNVYACLVCGKYFQGRGTSTHAYTHSVQASHHVFINLETVRIYCLPDGYEVVDSTLWDIKRALRPTFEAAQIAKLDENTDLARDQYGIAYLPGFVGLNNLGKTDYISVTLQALTHVAPLRDFFLDPNNYSSSKCPVVRAFGYVTRRIWSSENFKSAVSPNQFLQAVSRASNGRFDVGQRIECMEFVSWLLNTLHLGLSGGSKKKCRTKSSIIHSCFRGKVRVTTHTADRFISNATPEKVEIGVGIAASKFSGNSSSHESEWKKDKVVEVPFLHLQLDLPETPLFKDSVKGNAIPQLPLFDVLSKFDGTTTSSGVDGNKLSRRTYELLSLPPYVIFHVARFTKNNFSAEKKKSIVNIPIKNLDLNSYLARDVLPQLPSEEQVVKMSIPQLQALLKGHHISVEHVLEKSELLRYAQDLISMPLGHFMSKKFDLLANVCHESPRAFEGENRPSDPLEGGSYHIQVRNLASDQWYEMRDLYVQETMPQLIAISESYMMIYRRRETDK